MLRSSRFVVAFVLIVLASACDREPEEPASSEVVRPDSYVSAAGIGSHVSCFFETRGRWMTPTIRVFLDELEGPVTAAEFRTALKNAATAWHEIGAPAISVIDDPTLADATVGWREGAHDDCPSFPGPSGVVAHTGPVTSGTFIHLDRNAEWNGVGDIEVTLLHELGHLFGVGHLGPADAVMNARKDRSRREFAASDRAAIGSLYSVPTESGAGDLVVVDLASSRTVAVLPGVAPADSTEHAVADTDGDGAADIVLWRIDKAGVGEFVIFRFTTDPAGHAVLRDSVGPRVGLMSPPRPTRFGETPRGKRVMIHMRPNGRYMVRPLGYLGLPGDPWPAGKPLLLTNGMADFDADGVLDVSKPRPLDIVSGRIAAPDLVDAELVDARQDRRTMEVWSVVRRSDGRLRLLGPAPRDLMARDAALADLDGNGTMELVLLGMQ